MTNFNFALLDPRNDDPSKARDDRAAQQAEATKAANEAVFATGPVLGIEVTKPALAARCVLGNIDPQHTDGDATRAAIEVAMTVGLPEAGAVLATIRADLDSLGSMAVLEMRANGESLEPAAERIRLVAESDRFARGGWPGKRPLPTEESPWTGVSGTEDNQQLAAIAAAIADFKVSVEKRVIWMIEWLRTGAEPEGYRSKVEADRKEMVEALQKGEIKVATEAGRIATVVSTHRAGTSLGYSQAPVVIALNPEFRFGQGDPHAKFTICQFTPGFVDLKGALVELNELEKGWGGSPTIGGSPQGVTSELTMDQVVKVVQKHLIKKG